jgi:hypothetical protein
MLFAKLSRDEQYDKSPATTPIPVQLSASEFTAFILPHLSMPRRGPKCKLGYHRVFNLILWVLYTGMQWKCTPVPRDSDGTPLAAASSKAGPIYVEYPLNGPRGQPETKVGHWQPSLNHAHGFQ